MARKETAHARKVKSLKRTSRKPASTKVTRTRRPAVLKGSKKTHPKEAGLPPKSKTTKIADILDRRIRGLSRARTIAELKKLAKDVRSRARVSGSKGRATYWAKKIAAAVAIKEKALRKKLSSTGRGRGRKIKGVKRRTVGRSRRRSRRRVT